MKHRIMFLFTVMFAGFTASGAVESVHKALTERGVPSRYHVIPDITHYGIYREGFEEATRVELEWFDRHLKQVAGRASE